MQQTIHDSRALTRMRSKKYTTDRRIGQRVQPHTQLFFKCTYTQICEKRSTRLAHVTTNARSDTQLTHIHENIYNSKYTTHDSRSYTPMCLTRSTDVHVCIQQQIHDSHTYARMCRARGTHVHMNVYSNKYTTHARTHGCVEHGALTYI